MSKFKLCFTKVIPKPKRTIIKLSPQEKFNRIVRKSAKGKIKIRKYHFNAIEAGKTLIVFDGEGTEVFQGENSVNGCRIARQACLAMFLSAKNQNGGFSFTNPNFEFQTLEEIRNAQRMVRNLAEHNPFILCADCKFQFETQIEMNLHKCTEQWVCFEFPKPQRRIYAHA